MLWAVSVCLKCRWMTLCLPLVRSPIKTIMWSTSSYLFSRPIWDTENPSSLDLSMLLAGPHDEASISLFRRRIYSAVKVDPHVAYLPSRESRSLYRPDRYKGRWRLPLKHSRKCRQVYRAYCHGRERRACSHQEGALELLSYVIPSPVPSLLTRI